MLTKKDLLEAIEDMPMDAPIKVYRGAFYVDIEFIHMKKLWEGLNTIDTICIESRIDTHQGIAVDPNEFPCTQDESIKNV